MCHVSCSFFLRLCSEVPILEDTLMRILVIGLSRDLPLGPADAMELADHLVKRAAAVQADGKTAQSSSQQVVTSVCTSLLPPKAEVAPTTYQRAFTSLKACFSCDGLALGSNPGVLLLLSHWRSFSFSPAVSPCY